MIKSTLFRSDAPAKLFFAAFVLSLVAGISACSEAGATDENADQQAAGPGTPGAAKTCAELNPDECIKKPGVRVFLLSGAADANDRKDGCVAGAGRNTGKCVRYEEGPQPGSIKFCNGLSKTYCIPYAAGSSALAAGVEELNCGPNEWFNVFTCRDIAQTQTRPPCRTAALASCDKSFEAGCRKPVPGETPDDVCTIAPMPVQVTTFAAAAGLLVPCTDITQIGDLCTGKTVDPAAGAGTYFSLSAGTKCLFAGAKCVSKPTNCDSGNAAGPQTADFDAPGSGERRGV